MLFEDGNWADRDKLQPKHFDKWVDFCKLGCDFNPRSSRMKNVIH